MRYILDSNVALKSVLPEQHSDKAERLLLAYQNRVHELLAPDIFPVELAHALTRAERQKSMPIGEASIKLNRLLGTCPDLRSYISLLPRAVDISSQARIGVYDCLYVVLAEQENCELVTADSRLVKALPGYPIVELATFS